MPHNTESHTTENADEKNSYQTISLADLMLGSTKVDWVLEPFIPPSTALMIYGDSGVGKTWLVCDLALALASGGKWLGHFPTKQQTVLVVDEENSELLLRLRLARMLKGRGLPADLPIHFAVGKSVNLTPDSQDSQATITSISAARLLKTIERTGAGVVICDSLTRIHRANENASNEMAAVFANIKYIMNQTGASFGLTHHVNKYRTGGSGQSGSRIRGSTDIRAFCDTTVYVEKKNGVLKLTHDKSRWTEPIEPFGVKLITNAQSDAISLAYQGALTSTAKEPEADGPWDWIQQQLTAGPKGRTALRTAAEKVEWPWARMDAVLRDKATGGQLVRENDPTDGRAVTYRLAGRESSSPAGKP